MHDHETPEEEPEHGAEDPRPGDDPASRERERDGGDEPGGPGEATRTVPD